MQQNLKIQQLFEKYERASGQRVNRDKHLGCIAEMLVLRSQRKYCPFGEFKVFNSMRNTQAYLLW